MLNNKKTLLLIGWFFYPKSGGVESIMLNQAKFFIKQGYRVAVLTSKIYNQPDYEVFQRIKIYRRDFINSQKKFLETEIYLGFIQILDDFAPSIIHFHNGSYPAASNNMNAGAQNIEKIFKIGKSRNLIMIDHAHNAQLKHPEITEKLRQLEWDHLICVSRFVKKRWQEIGNNAKKISVVYNGIDLNNYQHLKANKKMLSLKRKNNIIIFFPARVISMAISEISEQKNFILLLKASQSLVENNIHNFKIVAVLNESEFNKNTTIVYKKLRVIINRYRLKNNVVFISPILHQNMPSYYIASDIVCVPSFGETFGLVYLEAMAASKIAIASNTGGPQEYIQNGKNGFLVDPKDAKDLSNVMNLLIKNPKLFDRIGIEAKKTAEKFSINKMMTSIEKIYKNFY